MAPQKRAVFGWGFLAILVLGLVGVSWPERPAQAAPDGAILHSQVVCAPGTHSSCLPGPHSQTYDTDGIAYLRVDVYLEHTGHYEPNEQSDFASVLGEVTGCGPIPDGESEVYCGQVAGRFGGQLALTVQHSGDGTNTGSHRQRYEINCLADRVYLPIIHRH
jgi:hypothetical protein